MLRNQLIHSSLLHKDILYHILFSRNWLVVDNSRWAQLRHASNIKSNACFLPPQTFQNQELHLRLSRRAHLQNRQEVSILRRAVRVHQGAENYAEDKRANRMNTCKRCGAELSTFLLGLGRTLCESCLRLLEDSLRMRWKSRLKLKRESASVFLYT